MTKGIWIATIVIGAAWLVLAAGCSEPPNQPATQLSAKPATQPAFDMGKLNLGEEDSNSAPPRRVDVSPPYNIVYLVDRSGSMAPTFERVRLEILKSISRLQRSDNFTIIFFADGNFIEGPQKKMVSADNENKLAGDNFLKDITATGSTTVLPGLKRAFQILKYSDPRKPGRIISLLSDGDFAGMSGGSQYKAADGKTLRGNEAVIQWLRENNPKEEKKGRVHVFTFLYGNTDEEARKVMETIAKENAGRFKLISADD
jgi:Mg-chelatase subunit ChlD